MLETCALLRSNRDARLIAGGTAVVLMLRQRLIDPSLLIGLRRVPGLDSITAASQWLSIGAAVTLQQVADSDRVRALAPSLAAACQEVGNVRVRNRATLGGNLAEADYASDPPAVLASLGAVVCTAAPEGGGRRIPVSDLITDYYTTQLTSDEVVLRVEVPLIDGRRSAYVKYRSRSSEDRPCVGVAASLVPDPQGWVASLEVVVGAVTSTPQRMTTATEGVVGARLDEARAGAVAAAVAAAIHPIADGRGSAWYRTQVIEVMVRRALAMVVA